MLKKLLTTAIIISLSTAYANQIKSQKDAIRSELSTSFNELNFKLNVEWDQEDKSFFNSSMDAFESDIADLQEKGLSNKQLIEFTTSKIGNANVRAELAEITKVIREDNMSSQEARDFAFTNLSSTYSEGASYRGRRVKTKVLIFIVVAVIVAIIVSNDDDTVTPTPTYSPTPSPTYSPTPSPTYSPTPSPTYSPTPSPTYSPT